MMRKILILIVAIALMISCGSDDYKVLKEEKRTEQVIINVGTKNKLSESRLSEISNKLKNQFKSFKRVYIYFHLDYDIEKKPWAVRNFDEKNNLDKTTSATIKEENKLKSITIENVEVVGKWYYEELNNAYSLIIFRRDNKFFLLTTFKNLQNLEEELTRVKNVFNYAEDSLGEYFIIEKDGNLGLYNKENKRFQLAKKI